MEAELGEGSSLGRRTTKPTWGGTPLPLAAGPSHLYKEGQGSPPRTHKFLSSTSGLEPFWFRASNCFSQRFRAF